MGIRPCRRFDTNFPFLFPPHEANPLKKMPSQAQVSDWSLDSVSGIGLPEGNVLDVRNFGVHEEVSIRIRVVSPRPFLFVGIESGLCACAHSVETILLGAELEGFPAARSDESDRPREFREQNAESL